MDFETKELYQAFFAKSKELEQQTIVVKTSKGYHVYLKSKKPVGGFAVNASKGKRLLDIKSTGGYCLAPPSTHPSGAKYEFISQRLEILEIDALEVLIKQRLKQLKENKWDLDFETSEEIELKEKQASEESNLFEVLPHLRYCFRTAIEEKWDLSKPGSGKFKLALLNELLENSANEQAIHKAFSHNKNYSFRKTQKHIESSKKKEYFPFQCETIKKDCRVPELAKACEECQKIKEKQEEEGGGENQEEELVEEIHIIQIPPIKVNLSDNFIIKYMELGKSITDAYSEYHFVAAVSILSTAVNRNLVCKLKHEEILPNIWFFCLGDSTISRKTTAMRIAKKILNEAETLLGIDTILLPQAFSPEAFVEELSEKPRGALWRDEAAGLLAELQKPYMLDMRDLFCQIYENQGLRRKLRTSQRKNVKTDFKVTNPYVTQWLLTTPDNFKKHAALLDVTSGWLV